jgi:diguanylate cyclase
MGRAGRAAAVKWLCFVVCLCAAILIAGLGLGHSFDDQARTLRDGIRARPATGQIHIVEIDAASIAEQKNWPWPRGVHAKLVDQLQTASIKMLAFDVDFSASTTAADDAAFSAALGRFGGSVILPTFRQTAGAGASDYLENLPIAELRRHAFLASVNVHPDDDGQMRTYSYGTITNGTPRPSVAALLAGVRGRIEQSFRIDQAIDPTSIPRHSYHDVLSGKVDKAALSGKMIIVGATAIELGDRYATPRHGVLPGVVVQAMAAETLIQATDNPSWGWWFPLFAAIVGGIGIVRAQTGLRRNIVAGAALATIAIIPLLLEVAQVGSADIAPALSLLLLLWGSLGALGFALRMHVARFSDGDSGLPNERALLKKMGAGTGQVIIAVRIHNQAELTAVLSPEQAAVLSNRIVDRLVLTYGGSEIYLLQTGLFALVLPGQPIDGLIEQVEASAAIFRSPIALDTRQVVINVASGVAMCARGGAAQACANARLAADEAASHGHSWSVHNEARLSEADRSLQLLADLDEALENKNIHAVFQPKWSFAKQKICGAEALVRWQHPTLGPIAPDQFIPMLEAQGRTAELTLHVLELSMKELRRWDRLGHDLGVAVNLSATLLGDMAFLKKLSNTITSIGKLAQRLTLEITESATLADTQVALAAGQRLKDLGIRLSIDDYGTGQSTLTYLKTFSASEIKIDKSFVTHMLSSRSDQILVRSTIELAHELGFDVVAEGIEDGDCLAKLAEFGCDIGQGWHLGKPMIADAFLALVTNETADDQIVIRAAA